MLCLKFYSEINLSIYEKQIVLYTVYYKIKLQD